MCGLLGTYNRTDIDVSTWLERIAHRGPDGSGIGSEGAATHGHVRLKLVDLTDRSAQPFRYRDSLLSFNGEIWNYRMLRQMLTRDHGITFRTTGDTEVLAAMLHHYGIHQALRLIEGMFAFAYSRGQVHILARDRFGKIPLYVSRSRDGFVWSSERKGFDRALQSHPLPPATVLDLTSGIVTPYYRIGDPVACEVTPQMIISSLEDGVAARLNADAPLCCLISGGLDSSLILSLAKQYRSDIVAYTAVLDQNSSDLAAARRLTDKFEVTLIEVKVPPPTEADLVRAVHAIEIDSKPQVEIAALCLPLAAAIASDGFKAALSGEAADELFGGYGSMKIKAWEATEAQWRDIRIDQLDKMSRGNFVRCNKAFMAHGVELRLPFMERSLVESAINASKTCNPPGKGLLKQAARGLVPDWVIKRTKQTFQGASGMADAAEKLIASPTRFYHAELKSAFG